MSLLQVEALRQRSLDEVRLSNALASTFPKWRNPSCLLLVCCVCFYSVCTACSLKRFQAGPVDELEEKHRAEIEARVCSEPLCDGRGSRVEGTRIWAKP